jgi:putative SOS response-associated peptidase YedK
MVEPVVSCHHELTRLNSELRTHHLQVDPDETREKNMCGRFTIAKDQDEILQDLDYPAWADAASYVPSYNVAPTQTTPVLTHSNGRRIEMLRWGLIPSWSRDKKIGSRMINARSETLAEKPSFRSLIDPRRCIVIADGYYEWMREDQHKIPHYIHHSFEALLRLAGLWDTWQDADGAVLTTFTIITTSPTPSIAHIHDRMPVILDNDDAERWIDTASVRRDEALSLLQPYGGELSAYPVSTTVNSVRNNSVECVQACP